MTQSQNFVLDTIEPDVADRLIAARRSAFARFGKAALVASAPVGVAMAASEAFAAGGLPQQVVDVLNFALTLEYLEAAFYAEGNKSGVVPRRFQPVFHLIGQHETAHVKLLSGLLGAAAVKAPQVDFTAGGKYADVFSNFDTFLTLSQTFEDLGVAAYKGQAGKLVGTGKVITTALQIHSVEARHAAEVRRIGNRYPWTGAFDKPKTKNQVLAAAKPFLA